MPAIVQSAMLRRYVRLNLALAETDDEGLEPLLKFMEERGTLTVSDDNYYQPTKKGREIYQHLVEQLEAYVIHFDIYALSLIHI